MNEWSKRNGEEAREAAHKWLNGEPFVIRFSLEHPEDNRRKRHIQKTLETEGLKEALQKIHRPVGLPLLETLIRQTLHLGSHEPLTDALAREAALTALLTYLRQNVGSCFATAPAILIQQEDPLQLVADLSELFATGALSRIVEGEQFQVPCSQHWGETECPLLKAWEYTLASLAETKAQFAKWNLFTSLGFDERDVGGLGPPILAFLNEKITELEEDLKQYQSQYDHLYAQAKSLEGRAFRADEKEFAWIEAEHKVRKFELHRTMVERDEVVERGNRLSRLYPFLVKFYTEQFKTYFQEVYDAEMHGLTANPYDDSPAGFRLLYKHGRTYTGAWTLIYSADVYIDSLTSFFVATEVDLLHQPETEGLERELSSLVTAIITHIKSTAFLPSSFKRLERAYGESGTRTPWCYISGGTMATLVSCYFERKHKPKEQAKWVASPTELLAFLIDTTRSTYDFDRSLLAFSPTHAFLIRPQEPLFRKALESDLYSYSWIRDAWLKRHHDFLQSQSLDPRRQQFLLDKLGVKGNARGTLSPATFRAQLPGLEEVVDTLLFETLPLIPEHWVEERLKAILQACGIEAAEAIAQKVATLGRYRLFGADDVRQMSVELIGEVADTDLYQTVVTCCQENGFSYPAPLIVGDTNWVENVFGFVLNPGTEECDFWRFDDYGTSGHPLSVWRAHLDGTSRQEWGIYTHPQEYTVYKKGPQQL